MTAGGSPIRCYIICVILGVSALLGNRKILSLLITFGLILSSTPLTISANTDDWEYYTHYTSNTVFTPPSSGIYRIICVGKSGDGGDGGTSCPGNAGSIINPSNVSTFQSGYNNAVLQTYEPGGGGAGGNSGAIAVSDIQLTAGTSYQLSFTDGTANFDNRLWAEAGADGGDATVVTEVASKVYYSGGAGLPSKTPAKAYGGNVANANGNIGGTGSGDADGNIVYDAARGGGDGGQVTNDIGYSDVNFGGGGARYPDIPEVSKYLKSSDEFVANGFCSGGALGDRDPSRIGFFGGDGGDYLSCTGVPILTGAGGGGGGAAMTDSSRISKFAGGRGGAGQPAIIIIERKADSTPPVVTDVEIPIGWSATPIKVKVKATDGGTGVSVYTVTSTNSIPEGGFIEWNTGGEFTISKNGTYYAWAKDRAGNLSAHKQFTVKTIDTTMPIVQSAVEQTGWGKTSTITVSATDAGSGIASYAVTSTDQQPTSGWQVSNRFTLQSNGTYYAWAKDKVGNISASKQLKVTKVDTNAPTITNVQVPDDWSETLDIIIVASDVGSGVAKYALTQSTQAPTNWQSSNKFEVRANGTYYAWAKDYIENVSAYRIVEISKIDNVAPVVVNVQQGSDWGAVSEVTITAEDLQTGVAEYAYSKENAAPSSGWQSSGKFSINSNGVYFAWAKDTVGNVSTGYEFSIMKIDNVAPTVDSVEIPEEWGQTASIKIHGSDKESGIIGYAFTVDNNKPLDGWSSSPDMTIDTGNGVYWAWVKDAAGNISQGYQFEISRIDTDAPKIEKFELSGDVRSVTLEASDTGGSMIRGFLINDSLVEGNPLEYSLPEMERSIRVKAVDYAGNLSEELTKQIPDIEAPQIDSISFSEKDGSQEVTVAASDTGNSGLFGIYVNSTLYYGSTVKQMLDADVRYVEVQALDGDGNTSSVIKKRVPGWSEVTDGVTIDSITATEDIDAVEICASTQEPESYIVGVYVDDTLYPGSGSGISCPIAEGTRYLKIQAVNNFGDRSEETTWRVPGWFDVLDTITVDSVDFTDDNTKVEIKASTSDPDRKIAGVYVSGDFAQGNPVSYELRNVVQYITVQAVNDVGDRSEAVRYRVPGWTEVTSDLTIDTVEYLEESNLVRVSAHTSSSDREIAGIFINGENFDGNPVEYPLPVDVSALQLQAIDNFGDKSEGVFWRVPGRWDELDTVTVDSIVFDGNNDKAIVSASAKKAGIGISGIYVNGKYFEGAPVQYILMPGDEYVVAQAVTDQGDRSKPVKVSVPDDEISASITIGNVEFSDDLTSVIITAGTSNAENKIVGIYVDGIFYEGNPVVGRVTPGSEFIKIQAQDSEGNRSEEILQKVPSGKLKDLTVKITSVQLIDENTQAVITATDDSGNGIYGIEVNEELMLGGKVSYSIPDGTKHLAIQAINLNGDRSDTMIVLLPDDQQKDNSTKKEKSDAEDNTIASNHDSRRDFDDEESSNPSNFIGTLYSETKASDLVPRRNATNSHAVSKGMSKSETVREDDGNKGTAAHDTEYSTSGSTSYEGDSEEIVSAVRSSNNSSGSNSKAVKVVEEFEEADSHWLLSGSAYVYIGFILLFLLLVAIGIYLSARDRDSKR